MAEPVQRDGKRVGLIASLRFKPPASPHFGGWRRVHLQLAGHENRQAHGSPIGPPGSAPWWMPARVSSSHSSRLGDNGVVTLFPAKTNLAEVHLAEMKKA